MRFDSIELLPVNIIERGYDMKKLLLAASAVALLAACSKKEEHQQEAETAVVEVIETPSALQPESEVASSDRSLDVILANQDEGVKARYQYRHPKETIEFMGITPGMTVIDTLPGGGYYTKILLPYLGGNGQVIGLDYDIGMWALFGGFATPEFLADKKSWATTWTAQAQEWRGEGDATLSAVAHGDVTEDMHGSVDAVMMVRAFHHYNRFEDEGGFRTAALKDIHALLKPGGVVGIVQHRSPEGNDDVWAEGDNGYVKQSHVVAMMEAAGFELVGESEINANPKDQPTNDDFVWRLPPTLGTSGEDAELRAKMIEIGESDRMTLKFRKN